MAVSYHAIRRFPHLLHINRIEAVDRIFTYYTNVSNFTAYDHIHDFRLKLEVARWLTERNQLQRVDYDFCKKTLNGELAGATMGFKDESVATLFKLTWM